MNDVIGYDMSAMKEEVYGEAIVDTVKPETLVSDPVIIKVCQSTKIPSFLPSNAPSACRTYTSRTHNRVSSISNHPSPSFAPRPNARKFTPSCYTSTRSSLRWECRSRRRPKSRSRTRAPLSSRRCGLLEGDSNQKGGRVREGARRPVRRG